MSNAKNDLFTVSTAEQPIAGKPERTHEPYVADACFSPTRNTLYIWTRTALKHAIAYLDLFEPINNLAPPKPFDPRGRDWRAPLLWATRGHVSGYEPLTGWQSRADGISIQATT